jgi:protoporphyrinogen oxidase
MDLVRELGLEDRLVLAPINTGYYHGGTVYPLSTPVDLLRFTPLSFPDRIRLGLATLYARMVKDWKRLEERTAARWLSDVCGRRVYETVWKPLLKGKFGPYADEISAVWFWNKLKLRGGSRGSSGEERMAYLRGGFVLLLDAMRRRIEEAGGIVRTNSRVASVEPAASGGWRCRLCGGEQLFASEVFITTPPSLAAEL